MKQKLITSEIIRKAAKFPMFSQDGKRGDAVVLARFFTPQSGFTWYMLEYDCKDGVAFGLVVNGNDCEYGEFSPDELQNTLQTVNIFGIHVKLQAVERDVYVEPGVETLESVMRRYGEKTPEWWQDKEED